MAVAEKSAQWASFPHTVGVVGAAGPPPFEPSSGTNRYSSTPQAAQNAENRAKVARRLVTPGDALPNERCFLSRNTLPMLLDGPESVTKVTTRCYSAGNRI
jgi:hypothetical protein